ncbi:MAG: ATP-binding protein [Campylobacter sp.]|nr:ATP-binding protein [Campylobacter sp.]
MSKDIKIKDDFALRQAINNAEIALNKSYLSNLYNADIVDMLNNDIDLNDTVRFYDITQIVINKNENMRDKLSNVFQSVWNTNGSILLYIKGAKEKVKISLGIKNILFDKNNKDKSIDYTLLLSEMLEKNLKANFPGTRSKLMNKNELQNIVNQIEQSSAISCVSDIAALQSEEENKDRIFIQGIEKLIDAMNGEEYSMLLIADPVSLQELKQAKFALENLYSSLVPYSESEYTYGENESQALNQSLSQGMTHAITQSTTDTITYTTGTSHSETTSTSHTETSGSNISGAAVGMAAGAALGSVVPGIGTVAGAMVGGMLGSSFSSNESQSDTTSHSKTDTTTKSTSHAKGTTQGTSDAISQTATQGQTDTRGINRGIQIKFENHSIKRMLEKIDETLKRYDECADLGMWNCAMYCISDNQYISQMVANTYQSLIRGKNSSLQNGTIITWNKLPEIANYLKCMKHPRFNTNGFEVTPATLISSLELSLHAGLPNKSVAGIPVIECAEFGRSIAKFDLCDDKNSIELGEIFHMHESASSPVKLDSKSLCSHTFITGSTGSGKSNTVYKILENLPSEVKFLIIEPAKGEYKNIFGGKAGVSVYGTNPNLSELLKINPFSFPKEIHVLEHIDRLIEIFNVCWPMYAAMPAVLKDAVEKSYEDAGWDLTNSTNAYGENLYPEFADVARNIKGIIDSSEYDAENKGAYKGSLLTRLKSLTNGLNGLIFNRNEISNQELFDKNVIVDISRVGSAETKSLIMGVLVLKLQEYRMSSASMNSNLKHITVLEEAHNLLKRTSTEQSSESANLIGKSVEMLTNAIAEMRTYGEGFIIADQAPALLDMAVIRNTNTKIIMRLPDQDDRELVGKAANLNDDQITELAKLPCGVAAVYQNEWIESVLCKIGHFAKPSKYEYTPKEKSDKNYDVNKALEITELIFSGKSLSLDEIKEFNSTLQNFELSASAMVLLNKIAKNGTKSPSITKIAPAISALFPQLKEVAIKIVSKSTFVDEWDRALNEIIECEISQTLDMQTKLDIKQCIITDYVYNELGDLEKLQEWAKGGF